MHSSRDNIISYYVYIYAHTCIFFNNDAWWMLCVHFSKYLLVRNACIHTTIKDILIYKINILNHDPHAVLFYCFRYKSGIISLIGRIGVYTICVKFLKRLFSDQVDSTDIWSSKKSFLRSIICFPICLTTTTTWRMVLIKLYAIILCYNSQRWYLSMFNHIPCLNINFTIKI